MTNRSHISILSMNEDNTTNLTLDDIISNDYAWMNIHEIVRNTFKKMMQIIRHHSNIINEFDSRISNYIDKPTLDKTLYNYSMESDVTSAFESISKFLENRPTHQELNDSLKDFVKKDQFNTELKNKYNIEDANEVFIDKTYMQNLELNNGIIDQKIKAIHTDIQSISSSNKLYSDLLETKKSFEVTKQELFDALKTKCDKQSLNNAMERKLNISDIDNYVTKKEFEITQDKLKSQINTITGIDQIDKLIDLKLNTINFQQNLIDSQINSPKGSPNKNKSSKEYHTKKVPTKESHEINELLFEVKSLRYLETSYHNDYKLVSDKLDSMELRYNDILVSLEKKYEKSDAYSIVYDNEARFNHLDTSLYSLQTKYDTQDAKLIGFATVDEVKDAFTELRNDIGSAIGNIKNDIALLDKNKANVDATNEALNKKADANLVENVLNTKALKEELKLIQIEIKDIYEHYLDKQHYQNNISIINEQIEKLNTSLNEKINKTDAISMMNLKSNSKKVDLELSEIKNKIKSYVQLEYYERDKERQSHILEVLVTESCVGRWVWSSGQLNKLSHIMWDEQIANTNVTNYIWEFGKRNIQVYSAGLYRIAFGFWSRKNPIVELYVNDVLVASIVGDSKYEVGSEGKSTITKHDLNVIGLSHSEYIAIPRNSMVCFMYHGEGTAEGFFELKKL